jgi:cation diffusion facilitator family transporter
LYIFQFAAKNGTAGHLRVVPERKTVLIALAANAAIAVVKGIAGVLSGSAAMLAEAAHSVADTANQGFLLVSIQRGQQKADREHPFGHGKERFFWSFLAAVLIFLAGAVFSVGQGVLELFRSTGEASYGLVYGSLAFAFVAEGTSLIRAVRQTRADARRVGKGWRRFIRETTEPASKTVLAEDTVAVGGVLVAALGVGLHQVTGNVIWDAAAAIAVGAILVYVAYMLGRNFKDLLIGAGARPEEVRRLQQALESHPGVDEVLDLRTMYVGPESLLVAARVDLADDGRDAEAIEHLASELDEKLRQEVPAVSEVFLDPTPR